MRALINGLVLAAALTLLAGCMGSEKGTDVGVGFDVLNTQSKDSKDEEKWFNSFYGKKHCVWGDGCPGDDEDQGAPGIGAGGGGMWSGGSGPSDSGSSSGGSGN